MDWEEEEEEEDADADEEGILGTGLCKSMELSMSAGGGGAWG
jgi:hypothetical protein